MVNRKGSGVVMMGSPAAEPDKARTFVLPDLYLYPDSEWCNIVCNIV